MRAFQKNMDTFEIIDADMNLTKECLVAAVDGPFFSDDDFHTLVGTYRSEVKAIIEAWPKIDFSDKESLIAISNCLLSLITYPHGEERCWGEFIDASPDEVDALQLKWRQVLAGM